MKTSTRIIYEYATIRFVPRVEREEFLNMGVILYCRDARFLEMRHTVDVDRVMTFRPDTDLELLKRALSGFDAICSGECTESPIAQLDAAERFRWLTANRSSILQVSAVHPGLCRDPRETIDRLHRELVLLYHSGIAKDNDAG